MAPRHCVIPHGIRLSDQAIDGPLPVAAQHGRTDQVRIPLGAVALIAEIVGYAATLQNLQDGGG